MGLSLLSEGLETFPIAAEDVDMMMSLSNTSTPATDEEWSQNYLNHDALVQAELKEAKAAQVIPSIEETLKSALTAGVQPSTAMELETTSPNTPLAATADIWCEGEVECTDGLDREDSIMEDVLPPEGTSHIPFEIRKLPRELSDNILEFVYSESEEVSLEVSKPKAKDPQSGESDEQDVDVDPIVPMPPAMGQVPVAFGDNGSFVHSSSKEPLHARVRYKPDINMLLVDKKMKKEYEERANRHMELILLDHQDYGFHPPTLPVWATIIQTLQLHLILFCHHCAFAIHTPNDGTRCHAFRELGNHETWIKVLLAQMLKVRKISIFFHICHDSFKLGGKAAKRFIPCEQAVLTRMQELQKLPLFVNVKQLALYRFEYDMHANAKNDLEGSKELVFEWKDDGVKECLYECEKDGRLKMVPGRDGPELVKMQQKPEVNRAESELARQKMLTPASLETDDEDSDME